MLVPRIHMNELVSTTAPCTAAFIQRRSAGIGRGAQRSRVAPRCHGGSGFTGGHLLHLAAADCDLNDLYREAAALGIELSAVRATMAGPAGHRVVAIAVRSDRESTRNAAEMTITSLAISPGPSRSSPRAACPV